MPDMSKPYAHLESAIADLECQEQQNRRQIERLEAVVRDQRDQVLAFREALRRQKKADQERINECDSGNSR